MKKTEYSKDHPKQQKLRKKLVEWVVINKRPLAIVEDVKLVEAFEIADDKLKVPTRGMITAYVKELFKKEKCKASHSFSDIEYFTCTNDAGSSFSAKSFIDVNVHYVSEDFVPKKKVLDVLEMN